MNTVELLCILMGDDLSEELDWGPYGQDLSLLIENNRAEDILKMVEKNHRLEAFLRFYQITNIKNRNYLNLNLTINIFCYYDAKEDL